MNLEKLIFCSKYVDKGIAFSKASEIYDQQVERIKKEEAADKKKISEPKKPKKKKIKHRLTSERWKDLRVRMLRKYKNECMKCGAKPEIKDLHVDHIKPKSKYPELTYEMSNLQLLCKKCNFEKSNTDETDYRK